MAARRFLLDGPRPPPPAQTQQQQQGQGQAQAQGASFPMLLPVFLFVLLLCFLSIFVLRDLLRFFSLCLRRRRRFHFRPSSPDDGDGAPDPPAPPKPPGLDPSVIASSFPTLRFDAAGGKAPAECAVCLSEFASGDAVRLLATVCRHAFHAPCIDSWLRAHTTCPVCRSDLNLHVPPLPPVDDTAVARHAAAAVHDHRTTSPPETDHR